MRQIEVTFFNPETQKKLTPIQTEVNMGSNFLWEAVEMALNEWSQGTATLKTMRSIGGGPKLASIPESARWADAYTITFFQEGKDQDSEFLTVLSGEF